MSCLRIEGEQNVAQLHSWQEIVTRDDSRSNAKVQSVVRKAELSSRQNERPDRRASVFRKPTLPATLVSRLASWECLILKVNENARHGFNMLLWYHDQSKIERTPTGRRRLEFSI